MERALKQFVTDNLFDAAANLLNRLKIKFTPYTKTPIDFLSLYRQAVATAPTKALDAVFQKVNQVYYIGSMDQETLLGLDSLVDLQAPIDGKYESMMVFAIDIQAGTTLTRTEISTLTRCFNRIALQQPVIVLVRQGDNLAIATCERGTYTNANQNGEKLNKVCILRNIDCRNPHRGHLDLLETLGNKAFATFDDLYKHWLEVFSTELLTKKFYTELSEWYAWVISSGKIKFPNDVATTLDDTMYNHEGTIRLITRLIFVWFLKQKKLIPDVLFDEDYVRTHFIENFDPHSENNLLYNPEQSKYYRLILQNLFFAMLNRPICAEGKTTPDNRFFAHKKRYHGISNERGVDNLMRYYNEFKPGGGEHLVELANSCVPFLSGGLFECLDRRTDTDGKTTRMYYDGFSENKNSLEQLCFPDYFFFGEEVGSNVDLSGWYDDKKKKSVKVRGLINILKSYNFTVEENTPLDQEISLDPELLGKVFENLLASYNPETNASARKQTGSFYTPREIVEFMIDESLKAYLHHELPNYPVELFDALFNYDNTELDLAPVQRYELITAIHKCRVLDPACGSGAFPMGILQKMVHALRKLDPDNSIWKDFITDNALKEDKKAYSIVDENERAALRRDIEESFNRKVNDPDYARKLYLIENCIYGVDIQPIATQISKLRFFISLVADQKPTADITSNFGIRPLPNLEAKFIVANTLVPLKQTGNLFGFSEQLDEVKKQINEQSHKLFYARTSATKKRIKESIKTLHSQYSQLLGNDERLNDSASHQLAGWDMFDNNMTAPFFDSEWMFGIRDGFDIVIGNPPYIQLQKATGQVTTDKKGKQVELKLGDAYVDLNYQTFAKTSDLYCLFYERGCQLLKEGGHLCYITSNKWMRAGYGEKLRDYFAKNTNPELLLDFAGVQIFESATVDTNILLFAKGKNQSATRAAIIGKEFKNSLLNLSDYVQQSTTVTDFSTADSWVILSPIEQSIKRKIESVGVPLKDWDIQINYGIKTGYNEAFIIDKQKRQEILDNCADEDERKRTDALIRPILRGRDIKRYSYDWAEKWLINTHNGVKDKFERIHIEDYPALKAHLDQFWPQISTRADKGDTPYNLRNCAYLEDFNQTQIVWLELTDAPKFTIAKDFVSLNTVFLMTGANLHHILGFLNSKIITWYFHNCLGARSGVGTNRWLKYTMDQLPIPPVSENMTSLVTKQVEENHSQIDTSIDLLACDLFGLSQEERLLVLGI